MLVRQHDLSPRQAQALMYILEHGSINIRGFEALCPEVNRRTLQRDLKGMVEKGLFVERGTSPTDPTKRYRLFGRGAVTSCDTEL